jgi:hypothetical protein
LIVWNETVNGTADITVDFGRTCQAAMYDPTLGTTPTKTAMNIQSLRLTLSDHPVIIECQPGGIII